MKMKLFLTALLAYNIGASATIYGSAITEERTLRLSLRQKAKRLWDEMDINPEVKQTAISLAGAIATTILFTAITMQMQKNSLNAEAGEKFEVIDQKNLSTSLNDVIGARSAKIEIDRFILYIRNPERFNAIGAKPLTGMLLYGPPGTGKTELARGVAKEVGLPFLSLDGSSFDGQWRGSGEALCRRIREYLEEYGPCVVFIDELDCAVPNNVNRAAATKSQYNHGDPSTVNALKTLIDGFSKQDRPSFFIGATNSNPEDIDPAIIRNGRLVPVEVGYPSEEDVTKIVAAKLFSNRFKADPNIDVSRVTSAIYQPNKTTGADVTALINRAAYRALDQGKSQIDEECLMSTAQAIAGATQVTGNFIQNTYDCLFG